MTKRIFRSIFCVSALVLVAGLVLMLGVLYPYFNTSPATKTSWKRSWTGKLIILPLWWKARAWTAYRSWL